MDSMSLSLDEIIKKKKNSNGAKKTFAGPKFNKKPVKIQGKKFTNEKTFEVVQDVRNKIIQKNRAKIRDAREKLAEIAKQSGDARLRLLKKKKDFKKPNNFKKPLARQRNAYKKAYLNAANVRPFPKPKVLSVDDVPNFRRTVQNDFAYKADARLMPRSYDIMPPSRRIPPARTLQSDWDSDPFGCYEVPISRPHDISEPKPINRTLYQDSYSRLHRKVSSIPAYDVEDVPMRNTGMYDRDRIVMDEKSASKISLRSQYAPSKTRVAESSYSTTVKQPSKPGYRIVVSNLRGSVSQNDIKELFEDIGELVDARLVKPGVAEVTFAHMKDAENAVDTYHNRQLDGQPMKCLLVNPRNSADKYNRNGNSSSKMEIDIDALHTVLFRR